MIYYLVFSKAGEGKHARWVSDPVHVDGDFGLHMVTDAARYDFYILQGLAGADEMVEAYFSGEVFSRVVDTVVRGAFPGMAVQVSVSVKPANARVYTGG